MKPTHHKQEAEADAIRQAAAALGRVDIAERCTLLGLPPPDAGTGAVRVRVFGRELRLTAPGFEAVAADAADQAVKSADHILALHYLLCPNPIQPNGSQISFRDLPGGQFYWEPFRARSVLPLTRRLGNDLDRLRRNLARFAWTPLEMGDVGARIQAVGKLSVTLVYHGGDDEFPADATLLFDACIRHVYRAEDVAVIASRVCLGLL